MSYDLCLFETGLNTDPYLAVQEIFSAFLGFKGEDKSPDFFIPTRGREYGPVQIELEQRKQQLAKALIEHDPRLIIAPPFQYTDKAAEMLQPHGITKEEALRRYRSLELSAPEEGTGIVIYLYDTRALICIPYWHSDHAARSAVQDAWGYLRVVQNEVGYHVYDPQREKLLDLDEDFEDVLATYESLVQVAQQRFGDASEWRRRVLGVAPS